MTTLKILNKKEFERFEKKRIKSQQKHDKEKAKEKIARAKKEIAEQKQLIKEQREKIKNKVFYKSYTYEEFVIREREQAKNLDAEPIENTDSKEVK